MVVRVVVAVLIAAFVGFVGLRALRAASAGRGDPDRPAEPEDVAALAVFFVCRECGTELQVTRLGETQIPRHCGEMMTVVRRPLGGGSSISLN